MRLSTPWNHVLELALLLLAVVALGVFQFSRITPELRRELELGDGLEEIHQLEKAHFALHGKYFDPRDVVVDLKWPWMADYQWDVRVQPDGFLIAVRGDLDGDGETGVWVVDHRDSVVHRMVED